MKISIDWIIKEHIILVMVVFRFDGAHFDSIPERKQWFLLILYLIFVAVNWPRRLFPDILLYSQVTKENFALRFTASFTEPIFS